jgi:hypothetical protein
MPNKPLPPGGYVILEDLHDEAVANVRAQIDQVRREAVEFFGRPLSDAEEQKLQDVLANAIATMEAHHKVCMDKCTDHVDDFDSEDKK